MLAMANHLLANALYNDKTNTRSSDGCERRSNDTAPPNKPIFHRRRRNKIKSQRTF